MAERHGVVRECDVEQDRVKAVRHCHRNIAARPHRKIPHERPRGLPDLEARKERIGHRKNLRSHAIGAAFVAAEIAQLDQRVGEARDRGPRHRSEEHTSELQSLMRISYAVFCLKKKKKKIDNNTDKASHTMRT